MTTAVTDEEHAYEEYRYKTIEKEPCTEGPAHHWVFPPPRGKVSTGVCKHCGDKLDNANSIQYIAWLNLQQAKLLGLDQEGEKEAQRCVDCERLLPLNEDYYRWSKIRNGYMHRCIKCEKKRINFLKRV